MVSDAPGATDREVVCQMSSLNGKWQRQLDAGGDGIGK